jgi:hypothetical protein
VATQARLSLPAGLRQSAPKSTIEPQLPAPKETCTRPAALSEQTGRSQRRQALQQWQVSAARTAPCSLASGRPQPSCASSSCPAAISSRSCRVGFRRGHGCFLSPMFNICSIITGIVYFLEYTMQIGSEVPLINTCDKWNQNSDSICR